MAKKFLTSIDLNGNQLINPILENVSPNPITELAKGRLAFNTTSNVPIVYNGSSWKNLQYEIPAGTYLTQNDEITLSGVITGKGRTAITTAIADGALSIAKTKDLQAALNAKMTTASYPSLTAIQTIGATATPIGFLKKTGANTWAIDTSTYLLSNANAVSATKLETKRAFSIKGGATAEAINFDGSDVVALDVIALDASKLTKTTTIPSEVLGRSTLYVGTTAVKLNRPSGTLALTGLTSVAIGDAVLKYDSTNNALYVEKANGDAVNFYSTGESAAYGVGSGLPTGGGGGVTALSLLTDVSLATPATGNVLIYNGTHWENKPQSAIVPNLSPYALKTYVDSKVAGLVDSAPEALDTLVELAEALGNDPAFATTVATNIGTKVTKNADITPGTGTKITYDAKGLVTKSASLVAGDIPQLAASKITPSKTQRFVTDTQIGNWNTAHGWGNHADAGYIKSFTNTTYTAKTNGGLKLVGTVFEADFGTGVNQVARGNDSRFTNSRTPTKKTGAIGTGLTTVVTHGLGSADIIASVMTTAGEVVECDIINTATTTTFRFNVAPAASTYKYVIIG